MTLRTEHFQRLIDHTAELTAYARGFVDACEAWDDGERHEHMSSYYGWAVVRIKWTDDDIIAMAYPVDPDTGATVDHVAVVLDIWQDPS